MGRNSQLCDDFLNYVEDKINVMDYINLANYSINKDYETLKVRLQKTKKDNFNKDDFYVVTHIDTDYYLPNCPYGILMLNLIKTFQEVDISLSRVIFITNIYNLLNEIKNIIPIEKHQTELPLVIDECPTIIKPQYFKKTKNLPVNLNVRKHAITLLGKGRVHRNGIYNFINENNLKEKIVVSYKNS